MWVISKFHVKQWFHGFGIEMNSGSPMELSFFVVLFLFFQCSGSSKAIFSHDSCYSIRLGDVNLQSCEKLVLSFSDHYPLSGTRMSVSIGFSITLLGIYHISYLIYYISFWLFGYSLGYFPFALHVWIIFSIAGYVEIQFIFCVLTFVTCHVHLRVLVAFKVFSMYAIISSVISHFHFF